MALAMLSKRVVPPDLPVFAPLPASLVSLGSPGEQMAVHVSGKLGAGRRPLVCLSGYHRNMADFLDFLPLFRRQTEADTPIVLIDLLGRGRSTDRRDRQHYSSPVDGRDVANLANALGIEDAVFLGQGYGGQVVMALAAQRPTLIAGAILIDAAPLSSPRGLVRLRNNLRDLDGLRSAAGLRSMFRRMLGTDYPGLADSALDGLAQRTHYLDKRSRVRPLFDPGLLQLLDAFEYDDVFEAQWPMFHALDHAPLMLMRTQLTDLVRRETFDEMLRRRSDAEGYFIEGQASPALLAHPEDVEPVTSFYRKVATA
jgi:pimeloyl-ACP methyl ester carboxylesterase